MERTARMIGVIPLRVMSFELPRKKDSQDEERNGESPRDDDDGDVVGFTPCVKCLESRI